VRAYDERAAAAVGAAAARPALAHEDVERFAGGKGEHTLSEPALAAKVHGVLRAALRAKGDEPEVAIKGCRPLLLARFGGVAGVVDSHRAEPGAGIGGRALLRRWPGGAGRAARRERPRPGDCGSRGRVRRAG
jgi:hypothetical protein